MNEQRQRSTNKKKDKVLFDSGWVQNSETTKSQNPVSTNLLDVTTDVNKTKKFLSLYPRKTYTLVKNVSTESVKGLRILKKKIEEYNHPINKSFRFFVMKNLILLTRIRENGTLNVIFRICLVY